MYGHPRHRHHSLTAAPAPSGSGTPSSSTATHEQPTKRSRTDPHQMPFANEYPLRQPAQDGHQWFASHDSHVNSTHQNQRSRDSQLRSHDSHPPSPRNTHTPYQFSQSYDGSGRSPQCSDQVRGNWSDVGVKTGSGGKTPPRVSQTLPARATTNLRPPSSVSHQRRGSLGGFSDDFAPPSRHSQGSPAIGRSGGDITQSQSSVRYNEVMREQRTSRKRSSATSDSDGNGAMTGDTEYQRLLPDDTSTDELLTNQTETETTRDQQEPHTSGKGLEGEKTPSDQVSASTSNSGHVRSGSGTSSGQVSARRPQVPIRSYEASRRSLKKPSEQVRFRRTSSFQPSSGSSVVSGLSSRQYHSDSEARDHSSPLLSTHSDTHSLHLGPQTIPLWNVSIGNVTKPQAQHSTTAVGATNDDNRSGDITEGQGEREGTSSGEPMQVSPVTTHAFETSDQLSDISTSAQVGTAPTSPPVAATPPEVVEAVIDDALSILYQGPSLQNPATDSTAAPNSDDVLGHSLGAEQCWGTGGGGSYSTDHELKMEYDVHTRGDATAPCAYDGVYGNDTHMQEAQQTAAGDSQNGNAPWTIGEHQTEDNRTNEPSVPRSPAVNCVYSGPHIMSPIAEVSQEVSTQQTATQTFSASQTQHTQFTQSMHSLSPVHERVDEAEVRRSSSPFHHNALGDAVTGPLSPPSVVSDNTNVSITSQVARVVNRSLTPQLEPPSTGSDTSHSLTRSCEADNTMQPSPYLPSRSHAEDGNRGNRTSSSSSVQCGSHTVAQNKLQQQQLVQTRQVSNVEFNSTTTQRQGRTVPQTRGGQVQGSSLQGSGTYQSTTSDGSSRERTGVWGTTSSWSTASAPPVGFSSYAHHPRRVRRSSSPTNTPSTLSDSVAVQFRATRSHSSQSQDQNEGSVHHRGPGKRRQRGPAGGASTGSGVRQNSTMQRISQDLEMMTRAIEGMDSGQPLNLDRDQESAVRGERLQIHTPHSPSLSQANQTSSTGGRAVPGSSHSAVQNRYHPNTVQVRANGGGRSSSVGPILQQSSTRNPNPHRAQPHNFYFRHSPNPSNSLTALSQIPPTNDSPDLIRNPGLDAPNLAQSGTPITQGDTVMLSPVQFPSAMPADDNQAQSRRVQVVPPPAPQPGTTAYDYLPPYSPPRTQETPPDRRSQEQTTAVVQEDRPVYRDPPPSYEEIFGGQNRRQRQRQRRSSRQPRQREEEGLTHHEGLESQSSQQEHAPSHRSSRSSGHRRLSSLTSLFKRSRRHSHDPHLASPSGHRSHRGDTHEQPSVVVSPILVSATPSGPVRASEEQYRNESPEPTTLERTASWVASYSQTPRPITAYRHLEQGFRDFRMRDLSPSGAAAVHSPHPHLTHTVSNPQHTAFRPMNSSSHSQPTHPNQPLTLSPTSLPSYRHPPPFLNALSQESVNTVQSRRQAGYTTGHHNTTSTHPQRENTSTTSGRDPNLPLSQRQTNLSSYPHRLPQPQQQTTPGLQREQTHQTHNPDMLPSHALQSSPAQDPAAPLSQRLQTTSTQDSLSQQQMNSFHDNSLQQRQHPTTPLDPSTSQGQDRCGPLPPFLISPYSRPLVRSPGNRMNLSQPNINALIPGSHGDSSSSVSASNSPNQTSNFRRVLAHPQRTRPLSSLVTSVEYRRVGSSMTSVLSPSNSEPQAMLSSALERLRNTQQSAERVRVAATDPSLGQERNQELGDEQLTPAQSFLPWQLDTQRNNEGIDSLAANGNANNASPSSPQISPNATPRSSPVMRRRIPSAATEQNEDRDSQNQIVENGASQNGNGTSSSGTNTRKVAGEKPQSRRLTQRSRAASRRLAQQLSSSDDEDEADSSSSSSPQGRTRPRRKRGDGSSRSSSRQGNNSQASPFPSPSDPPQTPVFFPSFQSQTTELPHDSIFSRVSSDVTVQSTTVASDTVMSNETRAISQQVSQDRPQTELLPESHNSQQPVQQESHDSTTVTVEMSPDRHMTSPTSSSQRVTSAESSHDHTSEVTAVDVHINTAHDRAISGQQSRIDIHNVDSIQFTLCGRSFS